MATSASGSSGIIGVSGRGRSSNRIDGARTGELAAQRETGAPQTNIVRATAGETAGVAAEEGEGFAGSTGERGPSSAATSAPAAATLDAAAVAGGAAASSAAGLVGTGATFPPERSNSGSGSSVGRDGRGYVSTPAAPPAAPSSPPLGLPPPQHASAAEIPLLSQQQYPPPPPPPQQQQQQQQGGRSGEEEEARAAPAPYGAVLAVYGVLSAMTALSALGCGGCVLMLGLLADYSKAATGDFWSTLRQLYTMALALLVAVVEAADWLAPSLISNCCPVFDYWVAKGLLQLLVAVLTNTDLEIQAHTASNSTELAFSTLWSSSLHNGSSDNVLSLRTSSPTPLPPLPLPLPPAPAPSVPPSPSTELLQRVETISLLLLLACAAVHIVGGVLCLGRLKAYVQQRHRHHSQLLRELRDIERRRNELRRGLLQPPPTALWPATRTISTGGSLV